MEMSGPKIAALYGLIPNKLGLCGVVNDQKLLKQFILGKSGIPEIIPVLKRFQAAYPYYDLIAKQNKIKAGPLNEKADEAYWIGNELLERVGINDMRQLIIKRFTAPGLLKKEEAEKKARMIPANSKPHHSFHVLVLGAITGSIDFRGKTKLKDICRVGWGKVSKVVIPAEAGIQEIPAFAGTTSGSGVTRPNARQNGSVGLAPGGREHEMTDNVRKITVDYHPLTGINKIIFGKLIKKELVWDKEILPDVKIGDWVSFHWNHAIQILNENNVVNLYKYAKNTLESIYAD